jgi:shikimate dehydrogenase
MKSGEWVGDNFDGVGFVTALDGAGPRPEISSAFLVGAGGVGTAIAYELLNRGYKSLAIVDTNEARAQNLKDKLSAIFPDRLRNETKTPTGFDCVINATPLGMQAEDRLPFDIDAVSVEAVVGDVVTSCEITRLVRAARSRGCKTVTGEDMLKAQASMLASFILSEVNSFE